MKIHNRKVIIISDGSYNRNLKIGAAAWVIRIEDIKKKYCYDKNITLGEESI